MGRPRSSVSARPNAGATRLQAGDDVVELDAQRQRQRGGAERVVDVVEAGERQLDAAAAAA